MTLSTLMSRGNPVRHAVALAALPLLACALALPAHGAEQKEVGITPVTVGAGPFLSDTAEQHNVRVDILVRGLAHGYALAFLPNNDALIVERGARLRLLRNATGAKPELVDAPIAGAPNYSQQDHILPDDVLGIQDVAPHPDFATNNLVYFTYNKPVGYDATAKRLTVATVLARARLRDMRLVDAQDLFTGETVIGAGGSRILFGRDGMMFVTVGALSTGDIDSAQRTDNIYGKVLRIRTDGTIPDDNPFVKVKGARREIYSYGHRDPLGLTFDGQGNIIASEHGPLGGDELNRILPGRNYGWPHYSYGTEYGGSPLPATPVGPGTTAPLMIWMPGIAPTGVAFYTGDRFPDWKGNLFIASARRGEINGTGSLIRVVLNDKLQELRQESLLGDLHQRFKDVRQGPDGLLYALTDEDDSVLLRISPAPRP
ncbi:PQQ-dependent sugar dehydrogenase [Sphingobium sp. HBC34]|uniref:PQQ-dependent sugar dehydrogenase n=1 Tax=Sphingobium cyanobacteriorum TaxID=3063954 RepID=A0ABT8ZN67_9SPHN|nr:PQQ-dependent sugar dehydrogenase [Sphingobium sp. HBC34]MDO7835568.1 PQQ-dependent sugar dehydrogenase [Sphingobium sp. HBC34]